MAQAATKPKARTPQTDSDPDHAGTPDTETTEFGPGVNVHALVLVSATALRRGHTIPGERCEIAGIGPIDLPAAKALLGDAGIDILVTDGIDVRTVAHTSRTPNRRQRAALLADRECEIRGCAATRGLEIDHIEALGA